MLCLALLSSPFAKRSGCQWSFGSPETNQVERFTGAFSITADPPNHYFFFRSIDTKQAVNLQAGL
jgi:hypothetical protein